MKKIAVILIVLMLSFVFTPLLTAESIETEPAPAFKIYLGSSIYFTMNDRPQIYIKNIGNAPAHNVTLTNLQMDGLIVYNDRGIDWGPFDNSVLEPGEQVSGYLATTLFGFGRFTASMTVSCDEGINETDTGYGIILGFLVFIP